MQASALDVPRLSYSIAEAARALGVSERSVYNLIYDGKLRKLALGRRVVIPASDLQALIAQAA